MGTGAISKSDISCVVYADSEASAVFRAAAAVSDITILDSDKTISSACEVKGTPTMLALWTDDLQVFDDTIGGDSGWITRKLAEKPGRIPSLR
jgi:hypothetical protein